MEACSVRAPFTLLGFILAGDDRKRSSSTASFSGGGVCFSLRDYFARGTNFLLWISLISITFLLVTKLARLVRIWARGSRIRARIVSGCSYPRDLNGMSTKHGISESNSNADHLRFGSDSQTCIGQKCAILGISTLFTSLLANYEIKPGSENKVNSNVNDHVQACSKHKISPSKK